LHWQEYLCNAWFIKAKLPNVIDQSELRFKAQLLGFEEKDICHLCGNLAKDEKV